jgi:tetratricopeptide (TPR) repeat protein
MGFGPRDLMATKSAAPISASKAVKLKPAVVTKMPRTLAGNVAPADNAARKSTLSLYESAIKLMQSGKYEKAHDSFVKMLDAAAPDLAASIRRNIAICVAQMHIGAHQFQTPEERYDFAVSLLNQGHYEDAREHLQAILLKEKSADYAFYGLALLAGMTGDADKCIDHLTEAIRLNGQNRLQARLDSDFDSVCDDPRFTELLYPEG